MLKENTETKLFFNGQAVRIHAPPHFPPQSHADIAYIFQEAYLGVMQLWTADNWAYRYCGTKWLEPIE
jgi:hypothetical protein